jgi:hypothetical protein
MAWTENVRFAFQEGATSTKMNLLDDNFDLVGPHLIVRKPSDESVASSATPQDDDHLQLTVAASEVWLVKYNLRMTVPTVADATMRFTFPSGGEVSIAGTEYDSGGTLRKVEQFGTTSPTTQSSLDGHAGTKHVVLEGTYVNGGTAGTLILQWAQSTINATPTVMKTHSTLWAVKLA